MKKVATIGFLLVFFGLSTQGLAQDKPKMSHSMSGMKGQMSEEQKDARMRSMQEHMLTMHDYSNKILNETDPDKKQKLKDEQFELMKAHHMQMMTHHKKMKKMHQNMMQ